MPTLTIGRVAYDVTIQSVQPRSSDGNRGITIRGIALGTYAAREALASELETQTGRMVAVTYTGTGNFDGFYVYRSCDIRAQVTQLAYHDGGLFDVAIALDRIGEEGSTQIESQITGGTMTNSHGLVAAEVAPFHAPSVGHKAYNSETGTPTQRTRTGDEGDVDWYDGIDTAIDPTWSVDPGDYYKGAARVYVSSILRAGNEAPNDVDDFELSNTLVKVTPGLTAGVSDGRVNVAFYNGTGWDDPFKFKIVHDAAGAGNIISSWSYVTIVHNDPWRSTIRLMRDANPASSSHSHTLDITLRRGSRFATFTHKFTGAVTTWDVIRDSNDACTAFTPTDASSSPGVLDDTATDGNKFVVATPAANTAQTTTGGIRIASTNQYKYMIGAEVGATPGTGNDAEALVLQYFAVVNEHDHAARR